MLLQDLTQPEEQGGPTTTEHAQHPSHANNDDDTANDNFNDLNGPSEGNESLLESNGSIPDTFEAVDAFPLDDFYLSNLKHSMWVPKSCLQLWAEVFAHITIELLQAITSTGPQRHRRIGTAARWYLGMPQIFLRDTGCNRERHAEVIYLRLTQYLAGDYTTLLTHWRAARTRARRKAKPMKRDSHARRITHCTRLFHQGFVSRGLRIGTGNGRANAEDPGIIDQMIQKHPVEEWAHDTWPVGERPRLNNMDSVVKDTKPLTGVGPRGLNAGPIKQLFTAHLSGQGAEAADKFVELGQTYFSCEMPTWLRRALNGGLLTPLVKKPAPEGETPDARPTNARDIDVSIWLKTIQRKANYAARAALEPQQLGVAVSGGCEIKVIGAKLKIEHAIKEGTNFVLVCLDLKNAHNEYHRAGAQKALDDLSQENDDLKPLAQAHRADCGHPGDVYMRSSTSSTGFRKICQSTSGGPQGSPLTNIAFPAIINKAVKDTEAKFEGVEIRCIQDDADILGPPDLIFGPDGALNFLLSELAKCNLAPNKSKFQLFATSEDAAVGAPEWLPRPFHITDDEIRENVGKLDAEATAAAAAAKRASSTHQAHADAVAAQAKSAATDARNSVPEEHRSYGVTTCGAALGDKAFVAAFLDAQADRLCNDIDSTSPGVILKVTNDLAEESAHCASVALYYSLQCRVEYLLGTHLPSETRTLADRVDAALQKAYSRCFGVDLLEPNGTWQNQQDPTFHRDLMGLKAKNGGMGYRNTARRALFVNSVASAIPQMMGCDGEQPLWASLGNILGADSFHGDNKKTCWQTFFDSGSAWGAEFESEIKRLKALRNDSLVAAERHLDPPTHEIFDQPDNCFGLRIDKLHRRLFNDIRSHDAEAMRLRALQLPLDDPRRIAYLQSRACKYSNTLFSTMPDPFAPFSTPEFRSAVQNKAGAHQSALKSLIGNPIASTAQATYTVDPNGYNLKKAQGLKNDGTRQNHDSFVNTLSSWLARARKSHMGGSNGKPRTCKGLFSRISYRLSQLEEARTPKGMLKVLQRIIPDIVAKDIDTADEVPSCSKGTLVDVKTLSPGDVYPDDRTGESNAAVNARQVRVNQDYHKKAKDLDARLGGDQQDGFEAELKTFGRGGVVLGPIVGAFGEMSSHVDLLADTIADALTAEHLSYYGDRGSKTVKAYYRRVLYRAWGLTAHRGWARLMLDRRSLVQAPGAPRDQSQHPRARNDYDEETAYESYMNPEPGFQSGPGDSANAD